MKLYFSLLATFFAHLAFAQTINANLERYRNPGEIRVVFYNVENLFDTIDDAGVDDSEFLPTSKKNWNSQKYRLKISNMAKAIRATGGWQTPDLVGVCEIENRTVLLDLAAHQSLKEAHLEALHFDSDDPRGIDVALLYNSKVISVLHAAPIKMRIENVRTRDILYAKLLVHGTDTLHYFVNHWPSRRGGTEQSEPKRMAASTILGATLDSILANNKNANILIMGDFNDTPENNSAQNLCLNHQMNNLMLALPKNAGSHKYKGIWDYLDQIFVSPYLQQNISTTQTGIAAVGVAYLPFLLDEDERYGDTFPHRTWKGDSFVNGFSDHLPVFVDFYFLK